MTGRVTILMLCFALMSAADPYDAWAQGRPDEAISPLITIAKETGRWDAWLDAGLAAAAAQRRGTALACLARAHHLAPERPEPRDGMRVLGAALPTTWCERAGPIGSPGFGWTGIGLLGIGGFLLGAGCLTRRGRGWVLCGGGLLVLVALPGVIAMHVDQAEDWICTVRETQALDSSGAPQRALTEGTLLRRDAGRTWGHRTLIRLPDGGEAWIATSDVEPGTAP